MPLLAHSALLTLGSVGLLKLLLISLAAGIGISAVGPGGVLMTIGLFAFTDLEPAAVAGTAIVTHIGTGLVGTAAYLRSGELRHRATRRLALILSASALLGIPVGMAINAHITKQGFGILLGGFAAAIGALVWHRQHTTRHHLAEPPHPDLSPVLAALVGLVVATVSSLFGLGGPMVCVPLLIALKVPVLSALAAAQAQSVVGSGIGTIGYALGGAIDWPTSAFIVVPQMTGVVLGWKIARRMPARGLGYALAVVLFALAPYLALRGG